LIVPYSILYYTMCQPVNWDDQHNSLLEYCASKKERFIMICWLNVDGVIGESSVLVNHHYQMVWFCYEMIYWHYLENGPGGCMNDILIVVPYFKLWANELRRPTWCVVLTEYWWSHRWISIGKPSLPNCVVLLRNDVVTSSGKFSLLYEWYIDNTLFWTYFQMNWDVQHDA